MNRPLTRELALLEAKLHLLRTQRHTLSDLSDIKEFRHLEELFTDTLSLTTRDGSVPTDPIDSIKSDWQRLADWNEYVLNWLHTADEMKLEAEASHKNPSYQTLVEIQSKLEQWPGTLQQAMEYARSQINEDDWVENLPYTEIIQIATIMGWDDSLKTQKSKTDLKIVENKLGKNSFAGNCLPLVASRYAANEGSQLIERRLKSFESLLQRTASLLEDHAKHQSILTDVHSLTFSGQFQSARYLINQLSEVRFTDLIYTDAEILLKRLEKKVKYNVKFLSDVYKEVKQVNEKSQQFYIIPPFKLFFSFFKIKKRAGQTLQNSINWVSSDSSSEENYVLLEWRNDLIQVFNEFNNLTKARLLRFFYILLPAWTAIFLLFGFFTTFAVNDYKEKQARIEAAKKAEAERIEAAKKAEAERVEAERIALVKKTTEKRMEWCGPQLLRAGYSSDQIKCLLVEGGKIKCWDGYNGLEKNIASDLEEILDIQTGHNYLVVLKNDGTVIDIDENNNLQSVPKGLSGVVSIASGLFHRLALKSDGTIIAWGYGSDGQTIVPERLRGVISVAAGASHSIALKEDGTVVAWGQNERGQTDVPKDLKEVVAIAAGYNHSLALLKNGNVTTWGGGYDYDNQYLTWTMQPSALAIAAGHNTNFAVLSNGQLCSWAQQSSRVKGLPFPQFTGKAISVDTNREIGDQHIYSMALLNDGSVIAWGSDGRNKSIPKSLSRVMAIRAGSRFNFAITTKP